VLRVKEHNLYNAYSPCTAEAQANIIICSDFRISVQFRSCDVNEASEFFSRWLRMENDHIRRDGVSLSLDARSPPP